jgi:hypothetical protein
VLSLLEASLIFLWISSMDAVFAVCGWYIEPAFLYKKADYDSIKREVEAFSDTFIEKNKNNNDIDTIWNEFKTFVKDQVNKYIPKCTIKHNTGYPWITSDLRKVMRKRDRAYSKMQKHGNKGKYRDKFKMLKHLAQKKTREAYWNCISDIIAPVDSTNERPNPKKFFTYLKSIRKESNGVPTLKAFGETVNEIQDKTNLLNRQFQSVFT